MGEAGLWEVPAGWELGEIKKNFQYFYIFFIFSGLMLFPQLLKLSTHFDDLHLLKIA